MATETGNRQEQARQVAEPWRRVSEEMRVAARAQRQLRETVGDMRAALLVVLVTLAAALGAQEQDRSALLARAYEEVVASGASFKQAEEAREVGKEPLPGERLGTKSGYSRLAPEYWERQKQLEDDVERAKARLDEALTRWNAVR